MADRFILGPLVTSISFQCK